ncbi:MAG: glycine cleavage system protein GcvH [Candidatus Omnitrophota bacterium]|nr:MAG: glycine cleavage system protein GcvH [Candidatus Omnitrophota bacterium]
MSIPGNLLYTKDHEWVKIEGATAIIGISDHAQHALGDITFVELPKIGDRVVQGKHCATVESVKAASDVYAPFSGKVIKINTELLQHPELANQSPYSQGWFIAIEIDNIKEKDSLMLESEYVHYLTQLPS